MARTPDTAKNDGQKLAALWQIYQMVFSTKTLLVPQTISARNFADLVRAGMIESTLKDVLLSTNTKPVRVYVYRLTSAGLRYLRQQMPDQADADYRPNNYQDKLLVHDLYAQAYLVREGLNLVAGTSSIDKTATHRRHRGANRWRRWRYDALGADDARLVALEVERSRKNPDEANVFLSKVRDFIAGTGDKLHTVAIICTEPRIYDYWKARITRPFELWTWAAGSKEPQPTRETVQISNPERVEIVLMQRPELVSIALPEKAKAPKGASRVVRPALLDRVRQAASQEDDEALRAIMAEIAAKASRSAVEAISAEIEAKGKAKAKTRLLQRNAQIRGLKREVETAARTIEELQTQLSVQEKAAKKLKSLLDTANEMTENMRAASISDGSQAAAIEELHRFFRHHVDK